MVVYLVRRGELVNVVAHYDNDSWTEESWIRECDRAEAIENYRGWHESLLRLFSASERHYKWALYDRDPIGQWTSGRVTILGDAAHPMLPYLGQGACQAMEDGCVLATALALCLRTSPPRSSCTSACGCRARAASCSLRASAARTITWRRPWQP